jgi:hypothetical protein
MKAILKIDNVKRPIKKGEIFSVPCIVRESFINEEIDEQTLYMDLIPFRYTSKKLHITPVINLPHSDKENGQNSIHYHADFRFINHKNGYVKNKHSYHIFAESIRLIEGVDGELKYFDLPVINEDFALHTDVSLISKSKLKHKCIHKGKCPHRGYDLSQAKAVGGVITCPLHGLKFSEKTKAVLNF